MYRIWSNIHTYTHIYIHTHICMYIRPNSIVPFQTLAYFVYVQNEILSIKNVNLFLRNAEKIHFPYSS